MFEEITEEHCKKIDRLELEYMKLLYYEGDNDRVRALETLQQYLIMLEGASNLTFRLPGQMMTPQNLIPLFNVATAIKLREIFGIDLPNDLLQQGIQN